MESYLKEFVTTHGEKYTIHVARAEDAKDLFAFYCRHFFYADPLGTMGAFDVMDGHKVESLRRDMVEETVKDNVSLVIRARGNVVAAVVNKLERKTDQHSHTYDTNQRLVWKLVNDLNKDIDYFAKGSTDKYIYMYMLAVDDSFRRQGLAGKLIEGTIQLAKSEGAGLIKAEFLSAFAKRAAIKFGFETLRSIDYDTFEYNGTKPLSSCHNLLAVHPTGFLMALCLPVKVIQLS